ncbi:MAG: DUF4385 domain-containing protein [Bacteroidota bacterium]|nr:DUF4385 domain-containing protein [Bacteroidota bacterium]
MPFDYTIDFKSTDFRKNPEYYRVGKGEQGVLLVEPYKSEILPFWRFKTPDIALQSSDKIYSLFLDYLKEKDFVGADMARKFLQMGFTRSRRYANHKSGRKFQYNPQNEMDKASEKVARQMYLLPEEPDNIKAASAEIFKEKWMLAKQNQLYQKLMAQHKEKYGL